MSKALAAILLRIPNAVADAQVISGDGDPSAGAGVAASVGTVYIRTDTQDFSDRPDGARVVGRVDVRRPHVRI